MPLLEIQQWRNALFFMLYTQYGGSGLQVTYRDVMEMDLEEVFWFLENLKDMRDRESSEIARARGG